VILSIETSTDVCSVALHKNGQLLNSRNSTEAYSHAEKLAPMIEELLKTTDVSNTELKAIAVSSGPGSYTGLRIGTSTAKGLCYALDIPLIAIGTLESMLVGIDIKYNNYLLCPMLDARRMEVYCLLANYSGKIVEETHPKIIDETSFSEHLGSNKMLFYGNGSDKCQSTITDENAAFLSGVVPSAVNVGILAEEKYSRGEFEDLAYFEPEYLKAFHAIKAKNPLL
jgi:tRNA threonylcarbamoyladenosine biosynthesis protein TsaB